MALANYIKQTATLSPRATVAEASRAMRQRSIGAIVIVSDDHKPIGLVTDRDIVLRVVAEGMDPARTPVERIMSREIVCVPAGASLREVTEQMRKHGIRRVPIVDDVGHVSGLVSFDDLVLLLGMELGNLATAIFHEMAEGPQPGEKQPAARPF